MEGEEGSPVDLAAIDKGGTPVPPSPGAGSLEPPRIVLGIVTHVEARKGAELTRRGG